MDHRGGPNGAIAAELAARSLPDGYILLVQGTSGLALNPQLVKVPYDDFGVKICAPDSPIVP